ncbi:MAG: chemotaxis response regulator protein-glutamate methylesterase [Acidiferrobacterales bacterium]|nr:chemotaxis response regulator protein-glutamate methylesterase [Acidiferrobacterales bacterium]
MPVKVLIVDDSALIRKVLTEILSEDPDIEVVGTAGDPYIARNKIKELNPDMITLDVEMPRMDGIAFLRNLMRLRPMPVLMISTLTEKGGPITLEALELGAVDYVPKPTADMHGGLFGIADEIREKVKVVAQARVRPLDPTKLEKKPKVESLKTDVMGAEYKHGHIIAIGASTGGTEAILEVLLQFPADSPPVMITQHIPMGFSSTYAQRLNKSCALNVYEARSGQVIKPGSAYLAPGDDHLQIVRDGVNRTCRLSSSEKVNRHRPSVDVLFESLAEAQGKNCSAALLTGMGNDGARGLLKLREAGAHTIAQDQNSCVVWGMPRAAVEMEAAVEVQPLDKVAGALLRAARF